MRKMIILFLTLALLISLSCNVMALENGVTISNGSGQPGQTVYLTVKLNESVMGSSVGLSYAFDSAVLEAVKASANFQNVYETTAGCTISCHCGPGTLGVLFVRK